MKSFRLPASLCALAFAACSPASESPSNVVASAEQTPPPAETPLLPVENASPLGRYLAGRVALQAGDFARASDFMSVALDADPENVELMGQALLADIGAGQGERAIEVAKRLRAAGGDSSIARITLGGEALQAGQTVAAERHFQALGENGVEGVVRPLAIAWARAGAGATDEALNALQVLRDRQGAADLARMHAGLILALAKQDEHAEDEFMMIMAESERLPLRFAQLIGQFYESRGRSDEAQAVYARYLASAPDSLAFEGEDAAKFADPVTQAAHGLAESLFALASVLNQERGSTFALVYAQLALQMRPELAVAKMLVGELHEAEERHDQAIAIYESLPENSPFSWTARLRIADNLDALGRLDDAAAMLEKMADERAERLDALNQLGGLYRGAERFDAAADAYDRALARIDPVEPRHWSIFYARGIAHERAKRWTDAEADLLMALELNPDQPYVLNYLGYSWVDQGQNLDKAMDMIARAVEQRPQDGFIVDSLGWAYYRLGNYENAVIHLEKAAALQSRDPTINDHLGDAYWRVGRRQEAMFQWRRSLSMEPDEDLAATIEEKLKRGLPDSETASVAKDL